MPLPRPSAPGFLRGNSVAAKTTRLALPHLLFVGGVIGYAVVGAAAFHLLEGAQDDQRRNASLHILRYAESVQPPTMNAADLRNQTLDFLRRIGEREAPPPSSVEELDSEAGFRQLLTAYEKAFSLQVSTALARRRVRKEPV